MIYKTNGYDISRSGGRFAPAIGECDAVGEVASGLSHCSIYINCHPCKGEDLGQNGTQRGYRSPATRGSLIRSVMPSRPDGPAFAKKIDISISYASAPPTPTPSPTTPPHRVRRRRSGWATIVSRAVWQSSPARPRSLRLSPGHTMSEHYASRTAARSLAPQEQRASLAGVARHRRFAR